MDQGDSLWSHTVGASAGDGSPQKARGQGLGGRGVLPSGGWHDPLHARPRKERVGVTHRENAGSWGRSWHTRHRGTVAVVCGVAPSRNVVLGDVEGGGGWGGPLGARTHTTRCPCTPPQLCRAGGTYVESALCCVP